MTTTPNAADFLKYAAARISRCADWAGDSIAGSICEGADGHEAELDALAEVDTEITSFAAMFGDPNRYSDGRLVKSGAWIDGRSIYTQHVWHPDPTQEEPQSWRGNLLHDPGTPCPGRYEVTITPQTQAIDVRVFRVSRHADSEVNQ